MPATGSSHLALPSTLRRFATDASLVVRLAREDPTFSSVCEDYELAATKLTRLLREGGSESESSEYLDLVAELEKEIMSLLRNAT